MKAALLSIVLPALALATHAPAPTPAALPLSILTPAPLPVVQAMPNDMWMDAPATPGAWRYEYNGEGSSALFVVDRQGAGFSLSCDARSGSVTLVRYGTAYEPRVITVRSETTTRSISAEQTQSPHPYLVTALRPSDPLLDAMALSKGRFAVEVDGLPPLYLPSHAEVSRVIEDCRG